MKLSLTREHPRSPLLWLLPFLFLASASASNQTVVAQSSTSTKRVESQRADLTKPATKPRFEIKQNVHGLVILVDGNLFAKYSIYQANKPYLWPVIGPTGKPMTRAFPMELSNAESNEQRDHPHHRGILFGHESHGRADWQYPTNDRQWSEMLCDTRPMIGGDTWHESATFEDYRKVPKRALDGVRRPSTLAQIKHREFKLLDANDNRAVVVQICDHLDRDGRRFLVETRRLTFRASDRTRSIDFDQWLQATDSDVVFDDRKDAGLAIRVPAAMAIASQKGGRVVNSEGDVDGKAWSKKAKWCDYHGPLDGEHVGIAILNHPSSYRFPTRWHVREYGLFAANPFGQKAFDSKLEDGTTRIDQGETLLLKHRFILHSGSAEKANIEAAWQQYSQQKDDE